MSGAIERSGAEELVGIASEMAEAALGAAESSAGPEAAAAAGARAAAPRAARPSVRTDAAGRAILDCRDAQGRGERRVSMTRPDGAFVEARTDVRADGVRSELLRRSADGRSIERWTFEDSFTDDRADTVRWERLAPLPGGGLRPIEEKRGLAPQDFLRKAGELFAPTSSGVDYDPLKTGYEASYSSASTLASGVDAAGRPVHVLASLGVHAAFPFPGSHWDEGQIAILDERFEPTLTLRMPKALEAAHLNVAIEDAKDPATGAPRKRISYQGYMEDDAGKLHFVQADYLLDEAEVRKRDPSLWDRFLHALNENVGFDQNAKVLRELQVPASSLRVDGREVLKIKESLTALDDGAHFNWLPNCRLLAVNYAPPESPLISTIDPKEKEARYRYDATLLADTGGLIPDLLPYVLRRGTLAAHFVTTPDGRRRDVSETMQPVGPPLSAKEYVWNFDGKPTAVLRRELVRFRDSRGNIELGFRETIRKVGNR